MKRLAALLVCSVVSTMAAIGLLVIVPPFRRAIGALSVVEGILFISCYQVAWAIGGAAEKAVLRWFK